MRITEVKEITGKSRSAIYADMVIGTFPQSILIGARSVAWAASDIAAWVKAKIDAANQISKIRMAVSQEKLAKQAAALKAKQELDSIWSTQFSPLVCTKFLNIT